MDPAVAVAGSSSGPCSVVGRLDGLLQPPPPSRARASRQVGACGSSSSSSSSRPAVKMSGSGRVSASQGQGGAGRRAGGVVDEGAVSRIRSLRFITCLAEDTRKGVEERSVWTGCLVTDRPVHQRCSSVTGQLRDVEWGELGLCGDLGVHEHGP